MSVDYGTDLSCALFQTTLVFPDGSTRTSTIFDVAPDFVEISGRPRLIEALVRRIITPHGSLVDDSDYGYDVQQHLNSDLGPADIAAIEAAVQDEFEKEELVERAVVTVTFSSSKLTLDCRITDGAGPFPLVLTVSDAGVRLIKVIP